MLDTDTTRSYADRANTLLSQQAIKYCPSRRLELESMAPHLASMLTEAVDELSRMYRILDGRVDKNKHTDLDVIVLKVISGFDRSMSRDIVRLVGVEYNRRSIEDSIQHLQELGEIAYQRRGTMIGWSAI